MDLRRLLVVRDSVRSEAGRPLARPITRVAACAVVRNPLAPACPEDMSPLLSIGEELGALLVREALAALPEAPVSYGKAAIVGVAGELEHAAVLLHPLMGAPVRAGIGGGQAIMPSNAKVAAAGTSIDVPLSDRDDVWRFDHIDTITVAVPDGPRPDEVVVIVALADGGRPRARVERGRLRTP